MSSSSRVHRVQYSSGPFKPHAPAQGEVRVDGRTLQVSAPEKAWRRYEQADSHGSLTVLLWSAEKINNTPGPVLGQRVGDERYVHLPGVAPFRVKSDVIDQVSSMLCRGEVAEANRFLEAAKVGSAPQKRYPPPVPRKPSPRDNWTS